MVAQRCLNDWADVWPASHTQTSDRSLPFDWLTSVCPQEATPITVEEIRANFKKPGRGLDGWDKPIFAVLPDQALIILAELFSAVEREGQFPGPGRGTIVGAAEHGPRPLAVATSMRFKLTRRWRTERAWDRSWAVVDGGVL